MLRRTSSRETYWSGLLRGGTCSTAGDIGRVISLFEVLYVCLEGLGDLMPGDVQKAHAALQGQFFQSHCHGQARREQGGSGGWPAWAFMSHPSRRWRIPRREGMQSKAWYAFSIWPWSVGVAVGPDIMAGEMQLSPERCVAKQKA
jgi:hypothetical protein